MKTVSIALLGLNVSLSLVSFGMMCVALFSGRYGLAFFDGLLAAINAGLAAVNLWIAKESV